MHLSEFHVVLVDDEPDVLEVSRLAMRHFKVYGLPIRLHTATSKAQAIEVLSGLTLGRPDISMASVALIDVVMETDHAGLELCDHIREVMKNRTMQICVRTGQPGIAPERAVLDRYDIQGYLSKAEATEDKLYTVVKAGIRQASFIGQSHALQDLLRYLIPSATSKNAIADALRNWQRLARLTLAVHQGGDDRVFAGLHRRWRVRHRCGGLAGRWHRDPNAAMTNWRRCRRRQFNEDGDRLTVDGRDLLIQIAPTDVNAGVHYLLRGDGHSARLGSLPLPPLPALVLGAVEAGALTTRRSGLRAPGEGLSPDGTRR
jgi:CheY-like chemotaxis protein